MGSRNLTSKLCQFHHMRTRRPVHSGMHIKECESISIHNRPKLMSFDLGYPSVTVKRLVHLFICPLTISTPQSIGPLYFFIRNYAKNKDRQKSNTSKNVQINEKQLSEIVAVDTMKTQMQRSLDGMKDDFIKNVSLRSNAGSVESLCVKFEGQEHTLQELAQVVRKNPKTIIIHFNTFPQAIPAVLQSIQRSGMNLNPQQDGTTLYVPVPVVTREHRENLAKNAKALFIKCRDGIKDVQNKFIKNAKNSTDVSQDTIFNAQQQITSIANQYITQAEKMLQTKQSELLGTNN